MNHSSLSTALNGILSVIFPNQCALCGCYLTKKALCPTCIPLIAAPASNLCSICQSASPPFDQHRRCRLCVLYPLPFREMRYVWPYRGQARSLVNVMKYRPSLKLARLLANLVAQRAVLGFSNRDWDLIVAVPSSRESFLFRQFNPALEVAYGLKRFTPRSKLSPAALRHLGSAAAQASLPTSKRIENVRRSFEAAGKNVAAAEILLVDDVVTSGATSHACAVALLDAGACAVDLFSLCRSLVWPKKRAAMHYGFQ